MALLVLGVAFASCDDGGGSSDGSSSVQTSGENSQGGQSSELESTTTTTCPSEKTDGENEKTQAPNDNSRPLKKFSIVGKWYTNPDDDRYYYQFFSDGTACEQYYQRVGVEYIPVLTGFVTAFGTWHYLDDEQTGFSIFWQGSLSKEYEFVEETSETLVVKPKAKRYVPMGRGLRTNQLLKTAKKVVYEVPSEISELIAKWYYDETKEGRYLQFQADGICWHYHYSYWVVTSQGFGGWTNRKGVWRYSKNDGTIDITFSGEITYTYKIEKLTDSELLLKSRNSASQIQRGMGLLHK